MDIPEELKYTKEHEWVKIEDKIATIGITDYAQGELGDIVFIELPNIDEDISKKDTFGTIEAVKAVSDMYAPLSGKVIGINEELDDDPMVINRDPYGSGWMLKLELSDLPEADNLLSASEYRELVTA